MTTVSEVESKIDFANHFNAKVLQSASIRLSISKDRIQAIRLLEINHKDERGIFLIERCIKNETNFLNIIEHGLKDSIHELKITFSWFKYNVKNEEMIHSVKRLLSITEIFYGSIHDILHRLNLERKFVEEKSEDSFKDFVRQWDKEISLNKLLLRKTVDTTKLKNYFDALKEKFKGLATRKAISSILGTGAFLGTTGALLGVILKTPDENNILLYTLQLTFMGIMVGLVSQLSITEAQIEHMNMAELDAARKAV